ncbi:hypothetical protein M0802_000684 [Mischocyttarus mexicanus]|nr:hypothetical protein M0802_000684 [Mischocyttarus mexicanus]
MAGRFRRMASYLLFLSFSLKPNGVRKVHLGRLNISRVSYDHVLVKYFPGVAGLKDLTINVPPMVRSGDTVTLTCSYDLEGLGLYGILWSLDEEQFYRYMAEQDPKMYTYDVNGLLINVNESDHVSVTLVNVSRNHSGIYKCEVSAGKPTYHTLIRRAKMIVVDAPKTDPIIGSEKERIAVGEILRANCTSGASHPSTNITWMLNGEPIASNDSHFGIRSYSIHLEDDVIKTKSHIQFKIINEMFRKGRLHLRCIAFISDVYRKSADMEIAVDEPLLASITGDAYSHSHSQNKNDNVRFIKRSNLQPPNKKFGWD